LIRDRDGRWNTANLLGPVDLTQPLPMMVIRQGTVLLEDRCAAPDAAPVEIKNLNVTIINDPQPTLGIQVRGVTDLVGALAADIRLQRANSASTIMRDLPDVPVGAALFQRLAPYCPCGMDDARRLEGKAQVHAELAFDPAGDIGWTYGVRCHLRDG